MKGNLSRRRYIYERTYPPNCNYWHEPNYQVIRRDWQILFPGIYLTDKFISRPGTDTQGDLYTESKAAVAGGVNSFIGYAQVPVPNILTDRKPKRKGMTIASNKKSLAKLWLLPRSSMPTNIDSDKNDTIRLSWGFGWTSLYFNQKREPG